MRTTDPILLILTSSKDIPSIVTRCLEGTLVEPIALFEPIPKDRRYSACLIVSPRFDMSPEDRFRIHAWLDATVGPHLHAGKLPLWL